MRAVAQDDELDGDTRELVEQLCTRAGMLMEEVSEAALIRASSAHDLSSKIRRARSAVQKMDRLLSAAEVLIARLSS